MNTADTVRQRKNNPSMTQHVKCPEQLSRKVLALTIRLTVDAAPSKTITAIQCSFEKSNE